MKMRLKYVVEDTDRHGNVRLYYRRPGHGKIRLRGPLGSPQFLTDYRRAAKTVEDANKPKKHKPASLPKVRRGTVRWLCTEYYRSPMFRQLDPTTQRTRRSILERFCDTNADG